MAVWENRGILQGLQFSDGENTIRGGILSSQEASVDALPSWSTSLITFQNVSLSWETRTVLIHPLATEAPFRKGFSSEFQNVLRKPSTHSTHLGQQPEDLETRTVVCYFFKNWDHNIYHLPFPLSQLPPYAYPSLLSFDFSLTTVTYI